jgi:hypothetical protein
VRTVLVDYPSFPAFADLVGHPTPVPRHPCHAFEEPVSAAGDHVILSGHLGDLVMGHGGYGLASLLEPLHEGHPFLFLRGFLERARRVRRPLLTGLIRVARNTYWRKRAPTPTASERTAWGVTPATLALVDSLQEVPPSVAEFSILKRPIVETLYTAIDRGYLTSSDDVPDRWRTFPYTHRPLIEFMLAVPRRVMWDPVLTRPGMQRALSDILPPELLSRNTKGTGATTYQRGRRLQTELLMGAIPLTQPAREWLLVQRDAVDAGALADAVLSTQMGHPPSPLLQRCLHLEAWLRTLAAGPPTWRSERIRSAGSRERALIVP